MKILYAIVSNLRTRKNKFWILLADDFELYDYHKTDYQGRMLKILETLQELEDQKQSILDIENMDFFLKVRMALPSYEEQANYKYLNLQRIDDGIIQNFIGYLMFEVPLIILLYFVLRKIFFCLFERPISLLFRVFSFGGFVWTMILEDNLQLFSYLSFRNFTFLNYTSFSQKMSSAVAVLLFFPVLLYVCTFYFACKQIYKDLSKYFVDNLKI